MSGVSLEECRFELAGVVVNPTTLRIRRDERVERVEPKAMQVLLMLARQAGEVVTRDELENEVWAGRVVSHDALTNTIAKLRRALGDDRRRPRFIETIPKRGYRLIPQPDPLAAAAVTASSARRAGATGVIWLVAAGVLIAAVGVGVQGWLSGPENPSPVPARVSVAVLPMLDSSGQVESHLVDGLTHDIIDELGRQRQLSVVAPSTIFSHRDTSLSDRELGEELGARFLIRGDLSHAGEQMDIGMRIVDTHTGRELWNSRYAGQHNRILDIKGQIVADILAELQMNSDSGFASLDVREVTDSLKAYDEYLRGRRYYSRVSPEDNDLAIHHFNQAIALDPRFARAYAALALALSRRAIDGWSREPEKELAEAAKLASRAAQIEPDLPQVEFVRGQIALFFGDHAAAISAAMRATRINPNYADAYGLLAWILQYGGRPQLAEKALQEALRRNPASNASYEQIAGEIQFSKHRYADALGSFEAALERNPTHARARLWLAATLVLLQRYEDAAWQVEELRSLNPDLDSANLLFAFPHKDAAVVDTFKHALRQLHLPELSQTIESIAAVEF